MTNLLVLLSLLLFNHWAASESQQFETAFTDQITFFECCTSHGLQDDNDDPHSCGVTAGLSFRLTPDSTCYFNSLGKQTCSYCLPQSRAPPTLLFS